MARIIGNGKKQKKWKKMENDYKRQKVKARRTQGKSLLFLLLLQQHKDTWFMGFFQWSNDK